MPTRERWCAAHRQAGGGYLVIPTAEDVRALAGADARLPTAAAGAHAGLPSSMVNLSIDMLLGGGAGGPGAGAGLAEARMGDWAPDGQGLDAATADSFAGAPSMRGTVC